VTVEPNVGNPPSPKTRGMVNSPLKLFLFTLPLAASCAVPSADIIPRYGQFDLDGHFGVNAGGTTNGVNDLASAGFGDDDGFFGLRADLDFGSPMVTLSSQVTSHKGSGVTTEGLDTADGSIGPGTNVYSDMDFGLHQAMFTFDVVPTDSVDVGIGLGFAYINVDATMMDMGAGQVSVDESIVIPQLAIHAGVDLGDFEAVGLLSGFDLSSSGDQVTFIDLDLLARYRLIGGDDRVEGSIGFGYRATTLDLKYEDDGDDIDAEFRFQGPYVTLILSL
jgi:hypothetical protein